jgi:hypothetical protein
MSQIDMRARTLLRAAATAGPAKDKAIVAHNDHPRRAAKGWKWFAAVEVGADRDANFGR